MVQCTTEGTSILRSIYMLSEKKKKKKMTKHVKCRGSFSAEAPNFAGLFL